MKKHSKFAFLIELNVIYKWCEWFYYHNLIFVFFLPNFISFFPLQSLFELSIKQQICTLCELGWCAECVYTTYIYEYVG